MTNVFLGRGAIVVENPPRGLKEALRVFRGSRYGGEYEDLFFMSQSGDTLSTLPGFVKRVSGQCKGARVYDERVPMPDANTELALSGADKAWHEVILASLKSGGGVVSVPDMFGDEGFVAAIARAYPRQGLADRGTPLTIVAANGRETARRMAQRLREIFPDRDVGRCTTGSYTDSDDIIVTTYGALRDVPRHLAGVFIGLDVTCDATSDKAEGVSGIRNAARWGVVSTSAGSCPVIGMETEGLFGPVVARATYRNAVDAGIGSPITVCWIPAPRPKAELGSAPLRTLEAIAIQRNPEMLGLIADTVRLTPNDVGCVVYTEFQDTMKKIAPLIPGIAEARIGMRVKERAETVADIACGTIRKAIVDRCVEHFGSSLSVVVVASCGSGDASGIPIPWKALNKEGDRSYIVDFRHEWDVVNGRPGVLAINDEARMRWYREMGFSQIAISEVSELPFIG